MHEMEIVDLMELGLYNAQLIAQQHRIRIGEGLDGLGTFFRHPPANPSQNTNFIRLRSSTMSFTTENHVIARGG